VACGQKDPAASTTTIATPSSDSEAISRAKALLELVAKTYREAPAFTDTIILRLQGPGLDQEQVVPLMAGSGGNVHMVLNDFEFTVVGDQLYVAHNDASEKYFSTKVVGTLDETLSKTFGGNSGVPLPLALRLSKPGANQLDRFLMNMLPEAQVAGMGSTEGTDGNAITQVYFSSPEGTAVVGIDAKQNLVKTITMQRKPANAPDGFELTGSFEFSPKIVASLPSPIAFDPGNRKAVDTVSRLVQVGPGDLSPDFTLTDVNGQAVKLADLRGSVVVLDFWATWCGPCKRALPMLEQFHKYTMESRQPIKVFAVNVWERPQTNDEKKAVAMKFWEAQKYSVPLVFDFDSKVAQSFGVQAIPTTVVIGPDGRVAQVHRGASDAMVELLKKETLELLAAGSKASG
jgi:thiol-disulfide isomerase/thioredoxin